MFRIGNGYDVHRLVEGRQLILCGVNIPFKKGLLGHSDADVALHALTDALLGAAALRDIGYHFPDSDPRYKGADSRVLLREALAIIRRERSLIPVNVDVTIIAQAPKLLPFIPQMIANVAADLGLPADVLFLLVNHCIARHAAQYGAGRLPTMRRIEQEGYVWARKGLLSSTSANDYLNALHAREQKYPAYMAVLQLGERKPSPSEEKYLAAWVDMGFPAETVALAYDKTVLRCHEFKWAYCNGILKKWHQAGLHSPAQVETGDRPAKPREQTPPPPERRPEDLTKLRQYIRRRDREE